MDNKPAQLNSPSHSFPTMEEWRFMMELGQALVTTGFMPRGVDTAAKAAAIMLKGRELGIPPMEAIANIAIINGRPTIQGKLMMGLVKRAYGRDAIYVEETTDTFCKVAYRRGGKLAHYTFTMEDAERAGLTEDGTNRDGSIRLSMYKTYPGPMLRARCISAVCIMEFPDVTGGLYVPGELGDDVTVDSSGEVITVEVNSPTRSNQQQPKADPQSARPAQIDPPKNQSNPLPAAKAAEAVTLPAADPKADPAAQLPADKEIEEAKVAVWRVAKAKGLDEKGIKVLLSEWFGKSPSSLNASELRDAYSRISKATSKDLGIDPTKAGDSSPK